MTAGWNEKVFVGIDPGATGAIALISPDGGFVEVHDCPEDERMVADLVRGLRLAHQIVGVVVERQQAMPKQGVASTFKIGQNYGVWLGILAAFDLPLKILRANEWKAGLGYPPGDYEASKRHSLALARRRWPTAMDYLGRKKDNGRAEALLLADRARGIFGSGRSARSGGS